MKPASLEYLISNLVLNHRNFNIACAIIRFMEKNISPSSANARKNLESFKDAEVRKIKKGIAAAVLSLIAFLGAAYNANKPDSADAVKAQTTEVVNGLPEANKIDNSELEIGSVQNVVEGVFTINPKKLNVRKSPQVIEDEAFGETNRRNIQGEITVANPVFVSEDENGEWFMGVDADGKNYFFTGGNGGITDFRDGKKVNLSHYNGVDMTVESTTDQGNVGVRSDGSQVLIATVVEINKQG